MQMKINSGFGTFTDATLGEVEAGIIVLSVKTGTSAAKIRNLSRTVGARIVNKSPTHDEITIYQFEIDKKSGASGMKAAIKKLKQAKEVLSVHPNRLSSAL